MSEDHSRQMQHRGRTATAIPSVAQEASQFEREQITGLMVGQHCSVFYQQLTLVSMRTYACFCNHVLDSY